MTDTLSFLSIQIDHIFQENERTRTLIFNNSLTDAQPGQYLMAWLPQVGEKPFSIAGNDPLKLTVVAVGPVSQALCQLQIGDRVWVRGPLGNGFKPSGNRHLLVGGGYGAAPLFYLAQEILSKQEDVQVCLGARTKKDLLLASAFEDAGILTRLTTDDGSAGEKGLVSVAVLDAINDFSPNTIYACGPIPMLIALAQICREKSINYQLSWEALIRCGMGLCGSCELDPEVCQQAGVPQGWLTCKDGPVFHKIYKP